VGARPGEKLVEEVVNVDEESLDSAHSSIVVSRPAKPDPVLLRSSLREVETLANEGLGEELSVRMKELASAKERLARASEAGP
jgi:FlaA1/EpsC-like NDP-sugar epimerase